MAKHRFEIDDETGEATELIGRFISEEQDKAIQRKRLKKIGEEDQDDFIWSLFTYCGSLFPDLSCPSVTRLFYIATFVEYDGNRLTDDDGYTFLNKRQLKRKLGLTDKVFTDFWREMNDKQILSENADKDVVVNTNLFKKGNIDNRCRKDFTRVYCNCVRYIYESCKNIRDHTKLAYIFKIIPYVNRKTNVVTYNPEEMDTKKIIPMTIGDFCDAIGYNRNQASRLFKELLKYKVRDKHIMCYVAIDNFNITGMFVIINPDIYYGGAEHKSAQFIFDICDKQTN